MLQHKALMMSYLWIMPEELPATKEQLRNKVVRMLQVRIAKQCNRNADVQERLLQSLWCPGSICRNKGAAF
jgi:hypothetical protein